MYLRARQEPEIPVIDRAAQQNNSLASKPPPGPGFRPREDAFQTDSLSKPSERPAHGQPPYPGEGQRQTDISKLFPIDDARRTPPPRTPPHQFEDRRPNNAQTELTGRYSPSRPNRNEPGRPGSRDRWNLQRPAEPATTLLVGTSAVDSRRREGSQQRKQEYREYLERKNEEEQKKRDEMHQRAMSKPAEVVKNQYYSSDSYEHYQKDLHRKQSEEYRDFLNKPAEENRMPQVRFEPEIKPTDHHLRARQQSLLQTRPQTPHKDQQQARGDNSKPGHMTNSHNDIMTENPSQAFDLHASRQQYDSFSKHEPYKGQGNPVSPLEERYKGTGADSSIPATPSKLSLPLGQYDRLRPMFEQERNKEYNELKPQFTARHRKVNSPGNGQLSLPLGYADGLQPMKERQRNLEYNRLLKTGELDKKLSPRKAATPPDQQGLPIGQHNYEPMYRAMEYQRNKEYNDFLKKKYTQKGRYAHSEPDHDRTSFYLGNESEHEQKRRYLDAERHREYNEFMRKQGPPTSRDMPVTSDVESGLPIGQQHHEVWKKFLREQRNKEYNQLVDMQKMKDVPRRHDYIDSTNGPFEDTGIFARLGDHGNTKDLLRDERKNEYLQHLEKYSDRGRSPMKPGGLSGPPVDHYQQMLNEKRREEAQHRRFDDPEFQDRYQNSRENQRYNY